MIDFKIRQKYAEEQKLKKLFGGVQKSIESKKDTPIGEDEDFKKVMMYIAKRLDFQIKIQLKILEALTKKNGKKSAH